SGKDVTWQSIKYASYCSTLTKEQIRNIYQMYLDKNSEGENAIDNLSDFFTQDYEDMNINQGLTQRIIIVAANFRKEVTLTVLWLINYKLRVQCLIVSNYYMIKEDIVLTLEQINTMKDSEEYIIDMAEKNQSDIRTQEEMKNRHHMRAMFWKA